MAISGNDVEGDGENRRSDALELVVTVYIAYGEAARGVPGDRGAQLAQYGGLGTVRYGDGGTETDAAGDGVEKREPLDKKKSAHNVTFR